MKLCLFCFSDSGAALAQRLLTALMLPKSCVQTSAKFAEKYGFSAHESLRADMGELFFSHDALIFIGACGIAVREIAPHLKSKTTDPAVLVLDDKGRFVIPVLSGHIGGANALAEKLAALLGAQAVITTATDGAGKFSCDAWAAANDCAISAMEVAKAVSARILTENVPICADASLPEKLPSGLIHAECGELGIYVGIYEKSPFTQTLRLIPRTLCVGIGCRRGSSQEAIDAAVRAALAGIDLRAVGCVASIDVKKDEQGLLGFAKSIGAETVFYSAQALNAVEGEFDESEFVRKTVGTGNVCERAAVCGGGELLVKKTALGGVTVAVAQLKREITF